VGRLPGRVGRVCPDPGVSGPEGLSREAVLALVGNLRAADAAKRRPDRRLLVQVEELPAQVQALVLRLGKDSTNSSRPPSSGRGGRAVPGRGERSCPVRPEITTGVADVVVGHHVPVHPTTVGVMELLASVPVGHADPTPRPSTATHRRDESPATGSDGPSTAGSSKP
jgi:hypothetical protein